MGAAASAASLPSLQVEPQFFGPEAGTLANWKHARDRILADIPGAQAVAGGAFHLPGTPEQMANTTQPYRTAIKRQRSLGLPSLDSWKIVRDDGLAFFPVLPRTGEAVFEVQRVLSDTLR
jgi:4-cresol dehydrogenase (hydroxylating)